MTAHDVGAADDYDAETKALIVAIRPVLASLAGQAIAAETRGNIDETIGNAAAVLATSFVDATRKASIESYLQGVAVGAANRNGTLQ